MIHRIQVTAPGGIKKSIPLRGDRFSIGRSGSNDLPFPDDDGLSRQHAALERDKGGWCIRDLHSKNGTLVNDKRITKLVHLQAGDRIIISTITVLYDVPENDGYEEQDLQGTVIFEAGNNITEKIPTHTVTLGELVPEGARDTGELLNETSALWADPVTALIRAGRELVARKPVKELFNDLLNLSMEAVGAGRGVLLALEEGQLVVQASRGDQFHISNAVRNRVVNGRSSLLIKDVASDEALAERQSIVIQGVQSLMAVPVQTDDAVLGLIYVDTPHPWREFTPEQLKLLTVMANIAAMGIERERLTAAEHRQHLLERELDQAAEIQQRILPHSPPEITSLELAGYNRACHTVGGDYYDFLEHPDGRVVIAVGDVAGKGMPAALLMVNLQARMQMLAEHPSQPANMVAQLNRAMTTVCPGNRFVTFFLCLIETASGELTYCNAGHDPPFLVKVSGEARQLEGGGPVLGILPGITYEQQTLKMEPGDTIVIYSDGVTEAANLQEDEFGREKLLNIVQDNLQCPPRN